MLQEYSTLNWIGQSAFCGVPGKCLKKSGLAALSSTYSQRWSKIYAGLNDVADGHKVADFGASLRHYFTYAVRMSRGNFFKLIMKTSISLQ